MDGMRLVAAVIVVAMCGVSAYGAVRIPVDARWPVRFGGLGFETTLGRATGLVLWPLLGGVVSSGAWVADGAYEGITLAGLLLMLWAQVTAVSRLARG
jgi:hypothetical protein